MMTQMRGISLLSALLKWYLAVLTDAIDKDTQHLYEEPALVVGGEKGCSASIVYGVLQQIAQKANEWAQQEKWYVFDADIYKAFDSLTPAQAARALKEVNLHSAVRAAWLRECIDLQVQPRLPKEDTNLCRYMPFFALR